MRPTKEQAKENRQRILDTAAKLFRENGIHAVGVDAVMTGAGLTHGGFYGHFKSKSDLAGQALTHAMVDMLKADALSGSLEDFAKSYLSPAHREAAGAGCTVAALGPELARLPDTERGPVTEHIRGLIAHMENWQMEDGGEPDRERAITDVASFVGALVLSRVVNDPALSDEILESVRERVSGKA
ncbi:TetR/AcrR family transcriptional repressor of nem operon [Pararhizobium capsulatum DSM 1112]|uniref:TetR/AcrR family transcriptional repressor of nem operon n=1 Tax=Pararhizobium capsulatum DSM 1112 TaxID=1121113 RepID=A0ABU0BNX3_9HYPH|nr:TetR family transcriptional regulator [Pararhizobium capsulatum]MDQ0319434.1 TetR/AcrR family transcriptional repressor of nem operon [Pararhizobium capsulatum DSM 1112]